jgi:uncharacterized membrane protein YbhN (UPF0104 family)
MKIINPYSFIIFAVGIVAILAFFVLSRGMQTIGVYLALGAVVIGLIASFILLTPGASAVKEAGQVARAIGAGSPVLLEFQSPY